MKLYESWQQRCQMFQTQAQQDEYWNAYFALEAENYRKILSEKSFVLNGTVSELAKKFDMDEVTFSGFIDGINTSLEKQVDLDTLEEETPIEMKIIPEELYHNMLRAKAPWLYGLKEWDGVLDEEKRHEITKAYRTENVFVAEKTVGRNDPCPCGSGKKYKKCCGKDK